MSVWSILGIRATSDEREIKRAYAGKLKITRPEEDPDAFQELRDAYEAALRLSRQAAARDEDEDQAGEVSVYTAAYQQAQDGSAQPEAPVYTAAYEFEPDLVETADPMVEARRVWAGFLTNVHVEPGEALQQLNTDGELLNLEVRDCFELCAVQYCAGEGCADEFRVALAEYFRWEDDCALISRDMPDETGAMLSWLRAYRSLTSFRAQAQEDEAVRVILDADGKNKFLHLADRKFAVKMGELIASMRWGHSEMLYYHVNQEVFEAWEAAVAKKRYFIDTAFLSFIFGIGLWLAAVFTLLNIEIAAVPGSTIKGNMLEGNGLLSFLIAQSLSFGLPAWFVFKGAPDGALASWIAKMVNVVRFSPGAQFGWIVVFAPASMCMFEAGLSTLAAFGLFAVMLGCALAATFGNSAVMSRQGLVVAAVVSSLVGLAMGYGSLTATGIATWMLAAYCFVLLVNRGGADLCDWLGASDNWIVSLRVTWLAGAVAIIGYATRFSVHADYPQGMWTWLFAGILLTRPSIQHFYAVIGAYAVRGLLFNFSGQSSSLASQPVSTLTLGLIFIAVFMSVNMVRAKTNQHQFS